MRLDHIAYRVADRYKTANFFINCFGYRIADDLPEGFLIKFDDGSTAECLVLLPPEKIDDDMPWKHVPWNAYTIGREYHLAPEIFISEGTEGSAVKQWVDNRDGIGGVHHLAYQVDSVERQMEEWKKLGFAEFATEKPLTCPGLTQVFTKPSQLTGVIYEFIEREQHGFCVDNVKNLMLSTKDFK